MAEFVRITDVSPRDGLQNEPGVIPTERKVRLIELLSRTGADEIEITSFVSPKWVPQLGDAEEVVAGVLELMSRVRGEAHPPLPPGEGQGRGASSESQHSLPSLGDTKASHIPEKYPTAKRPPGAIERARQLRAGLTIPEKRLWSRLRADRLAALRFRRQHAIGPYIVDFYCPAAHLIIEIDGRSHQSPEAASADRQRSAYLAGQGLRVIRFTNDEILRSLDGVVKSIMREIDSPGSFQRSAPLPYPSPRGRGESGERQEPTERPRHESGDDEVPPPSGRGKGGGDSEHIPTPTNTSPLLSALVPNIRGLDRVLALNERAGFPLIGKVSVFTAASETFSQRNTNATIAQTIERFRPVVDAAIDADLDIRAYISCAISCPFEGAIAPSKVLEVAQMLDAIHIDEIDLGDTIGVAYPADIAALLSAFTDFPGDLTLHLHDTFGRAADCVRTALEMGIRSFDGSVAGLGGCPYASTPGNRAPGNIATELLNRTIRDAGYATNIDADALAEAAAYANRIVAESRVVGEESGQS